MVVGVARSATLEVGEVALMIKREERGMELVAIGKGKGKGKSEAGNGIHANGSQGWTFVLIPPTRR